MRGPAVVVLHESSGLNDDIRQQADRLAAAGYLAVAPDLFSAGGRLRCIRGVFRALLKGDAALHGACPIVASYGAKDRMMPGGTAAKLEAALERARVDHDVKEYPGAGHSFLNRHDFGPGGALLRVAGVGYDGASAEDASARILRFVAAHLAAPANTQVRNAT